VPGDELVDEVELVLGPPVQLHDAPVADDERRRRVVRAREGDQAELGLLGDEMVPADGTGRVER
jgi:hypothetical protein